MKKLLFNFIFGLVGFLAAGATKVHALNFSITQPANTVPGDRANLGNFITFILNVLVVVGIIATIAYLLYGGIKWITSGGDKAGVEAARSHIVAAIIGLVIILLAFVILKIVFQLMGINVDIFNYSIPSLNT